MSHCALRTSSSGDEKKHASSSYLKNCIKSSVRSASMTLPQAGISKQRRV
jgi:hypothetical protein